MANIYKELALLSQKIFYIYLQRDYYEKHFIYEKEIHEWRLRIFSEMQKISSNNLIDHAVEIITALGNLRYRIRDHTIFEVCEPELSRLSATIFNSFMQLTTLDGKVSDDFLSSIHAFEDVYRSALQVVAKEPIVFLIFIQNLYALNNLFTLLKAEQDA